MGLFNFNINTNTNTDHNQDAPKTIVLCLNEEQVEVQLKDAENTTIQDLFEEYADSLGDTERISRFIVSGRVVDGNATPQPGMVYRGAISSESKG